MHTNDRLTIQRVERFITERLDRAVHRDHVPLTVTAWQAADEPVPCAEAVSQRFEEVSPGFAWGRPWGTTWFHVTGEVPAHWLEDGSVPTGLSAEVLVDLGFTEHRPGGQAEGLAFTPEGAVIKAIQPRNNYVPVQPGVIDLYVEAAANPPLGFEPNPFDPTPLGDKATAPPRPLYALREVVVALRDVTVWSLAQDARLLLDLVRELPAESTRRARVLHALDTMCDEIDPDDVSATAPRGSAALADVLASPAHSSAHHIFAVGHAHIDSAWLWPVRETIRKCARTWSNQLALMDADPEYRFVSSSAQQFAWIEKHYPELFKRVQAKVATGQFVPVGSMWVEADTNMPGGEALARQLVLGKRYFASRFGIETTDVWLPDSFGYSGALPQLARAAGAHNFLSQKLSWNESNRMPHHTFTWEGLDGSAVFAHFPPVDTYSSDLSPRELIHAEAEYQEKRSASSSLVPFGWGDGGGGATREMIAVAHREKDLEGLPKVTLATPDEFFAHARAEYPHPPTWVGEMYLEFHRGTYTTQARMKRGNRRMEHLLREAELWAATASVREGAEYPYDELGRIWESVLLYQFHDILPGSSIGWVHQEAERDYEVFERDLEHMIARAAGAVVGEGTTRLHLNAAPHEHDGVAAMSAGEATQHPQRPVRLERRGDGIVVENGALRVEISPRGTITSLVDIANARETIPAGVESNVLQLHRDTPKAWDAWDIDVEYRRASTDVTDVASLEVREDNGRAVVEIERTFGNSSVHQELTILQGSPELTIMTEVDWHEKQKLLKLAFPVDLMAERAASETQFGHVFRPTHTNTTWDAAKFETCAHRWVHVDEGGYGIAVTNDATYGHDITRVAQEGAHPYTMIRQSLLRSALFPDPRADEGRHVFTSTLRLGATVEDAVISGFRTNLGVREVMGNHGAESLISVDAPGVVVESVKLAEDRSGDVVVRLYEALGRRTRGSVRANFAARRVVEVDLLEREQASQMPDEARDYLDLDLRPFQIATVRFSR